MQHLRKITLYKNHGGKTGYWTCGAEQAEDGSARLVITYAKTLDGKPVTKYDPVVGKNIGRSNETSPADQAVLEMESRINKQLDKGYVRTLEDAAAPATNSLGLQKPMLAHPIDKVDAGKIDWANAFAQPKLDGHRCLVNGIMYSRNGKEILLPHIRDFLGDHGLLDKKLDGELYVHGEMLQDIGSLIKKPREESLQIQYHIYDVISRVPYADRHAWLVDELHAVLTTPDSPIQLVSALPVRNREELTTLHDSWKASGYEGSMLRHGLEGYADGKRSSSLLKVKDFSDAEFVVVGFERGTPNGELEVPVWVLANPAGLTPEAKTFRATAQGDMHEKNRQWVYRRDFVGKALTVQFFGVSKDSVPLLPVALRWRDDV